MALTTKQEGAVALDDSNTRIRKRSATAESLAAFQASATATALVDAFARAAAHRAVADAKRLPEGENGSR